MTTPSEDMAEVFSFLIAKKKILKIDKNFKF